MDRSGFAEPELTIRPYRSRGLWLYASVAVVIVALVTAARAFMRSESPVLTIGVISIVVLAFTMFTLDFYAQTKLVVTGGVVRRSGLLGRTATCRVADIALVIEAPVRYTAVNTRPERWLWFMDTEGRTVMRVWAEHYRFRDLEHLKALLGVPWNYETAYSRMLDFERAHPRSVPWPLAHYWLSSLAAITASLVVLGFVLVLVQQG